MNVAIPKTKAEQALTEAFAAAAPKLPGSAAVKSARANAIGEFGALGLPHRRIEEWKYTDLRVQLKDIGATAVDDATAVSADDLRAALGALADVDAHRIVFVNGSHRAQLSALDGAKGLDVQPLAAALKSVPEKIADGLMRATGPKSDATVALNTAFVSDGAIVRIAGGAELTKPLMIVFLSAGTTSRLTSVRNIISAGEGSIATVIEVHASLKSAATGGQVNALSEVRCPHADVRRR